MDEAIKTQILEKLNELVARISPDANTRSMYGGIIIELVSDDPKSRIGGFFVYADYVSFEFAKGVLFEDEGAHLEGAGKLRRHLKFRALEDVEAKDCAGFLQQAVNSANA
ncbi:MAG: DUF1801 domain-containing protein [Nitratireductor sp.]